MIAHTYEEELTESKYLASAATCTSKASYYYSCSCGAVGTESFEYGNMLAHAYVQEIVREEYLKSTATCTSKAVYYKSCICGVFSTEIFKYGKALGHSGTDSICSICQDKIHSVGLKYTLSSDSKTYTVSGIGECTDIDVIIPSEYEGKPVVAIGASAFKSCSRLKSITIPDSINTIGSYPFENCNKISLYCEAKSAPSGWSPTYILYVGDIIWNYSGFRGITDDGIVWLQTNAEEILILDYIGEAQDLIIPKTINNSPVISIEKKAFYGSDNLVSVIVPNTVTTIEESAFGSCYSLEYIALPFVGRSKNATSYDSVFGYIFGYSTTYENKGEKYGSGVYQWYEIFSSMGTTMENFYYYYIPYSLTSVAIEGGKIEGNAFRNCSYLTNITIGDSVTIIEGLSFFNCDKLQNIVIDSANNNYQIIDEAIYSKDGKSLVRLAPGSTKLSYEIPNSVQIIESNAFSSCKNLTHVVIPDSVTTISGSAFHSCDNLLEINFPKSLTYIGAAAFANCSKLTSITIPENVGFIDWSAFSNCYNLTEINYNASLCVLGQADAVYLPGSTNIFANAGKDGTGIILTIGANVKSIPAYLFYPFAENPLKNTANVRSIIFEDESVCESIGKYAFYGFTNLSTIVYTAKKCASLGVDNYTFAYAGKNSSGITVTIGTDVQQIPSYLFKPSSYTSEAANIISVVFEKGSNCETIGTQAFYGCSGLGSIEIPEKVSSIGTKAFYDCVGLTEIVYNATECGKFNSVFNHSKNNVTITIGANVKIIPENFATNSDVTNYGVVSVIFEEGSVCTTIKKNAFYGCRHLESIVIPASVTSIGAWAFDGCDSLTIYCEASSEPLGWSSFWNYSDYPVVWGITKQTYIFETNGGSLVETKNTVSLNNLPVTTKDGYFFGGWYDNAEFSGEPISAPYYSSSKTTLYAKWLSKEEYYDGTSFEKAINMETGKSYEVIIDTAEEIVYFSFTATKTESYTIKSNGGLDTYGYLYNSSKTQLTYNDGGTDFTITYNLTAGETYYIAVKMYSTSATGSFTVSVT